MAKAMKSGKKTNYSITLSAPGGRVIIGDLRDAPDRVATAKITVIWRERSDQTVTGGMMLHYRGWDDRAAEQWVAFTGTPAKVGRYCWRLTCPDTGQKVQALYLAPDGDRFQSHQASELKYRRAHSKADRHLRHCCKLAHKLQTDHFGPGIGQPAGMSDRKFDKLEWQLTKEHLRYLCALLKRAEPEFHDEEPPVSKSPKPKPKAAASPDFSPVRSMYFRDRHGTLQMQGKFLKKFGM